MRLSSVIAPRDREFFDLFEEAGGNIVRVADLLDRMLRAFPERGDDLARDILIIVVVTALAFDFTNGFHDTANVVATAISTRAMPPKVAVGYAAILAATHVGFPLSTTHTISGAVMGAGAAKRVSAVRWGVAGNIVIAWILTLPAAAGIGALTYGVTRIFGTGARADDRVRGPGRGDRRRLRPPPAAGLPDNGRGGLAAAFAAVMSLVVFGVIVMTAK